MIPGVNIINGKASVVSANKTGCLVPVLAKMIMTELEKTVAQKLTTTGMIKLYWRYVDDTLLLLKPADIPHIHILFNKFDKI